MNADPSPSERRFAPITPTKLAFVTIWTWDYFIFGNKWGPWYKQKDDDSIDIPGIKARVLACLPGPGEEKGNGVGLHTKPV